ncbi:cell division protein ZapA [Acuticoccus sp. MNP-M23]|uniref:cell division protein ZapA n=1 Tax=Acuticoccus sp. MNP-M23 TaxID=3072793 RepID=UPI00281593D7|nr:cell division protein ZapA [Acuticoccus sp. MNP-M23]WMS43215.1 cell division protein ZapA [Acuticoccus sp. MNP-M23]
MNRVTVSIGGLEYTVACNPGEEDRLQDLAAGFDEIVQGMKVKVGEIGDRRIAVMAGLSVLDRLHAAEAQNARLTHRVAVLERAREAAALAAESDDDTLVQRLEETAAAIDTITSLINRDTRNRTRTGERKVVPTAAVASRGRPAAPADEAGPPAPEGEAETQPAGEPEADGPEDGAGAIVPAKDRRPA